MDTYSAADVARRLGTSTPRVVRAARRLGFSPAANGRMSLSHTMVERLRDELGRTPYIVGLTPTEVKALAALARAPLGLSSARVLAGQAGISPTAASRALRSLEDKNLARREDSVIAAGRARPVKLAHANRRSARWLEIAPLLARVRPPKTRSARVASVPPRLRHLFWNAAPAQLDVLESGPYIARRLLSALDFDGLAWATGRLRPSDWRRAAKARGLDDSTRALAHNLALYGGR